MKKINIFLLTVLAALAIVIVYFFCGTDMKVDAAAAYENGGIRCELTLSNGSLFNYEYLEFLPVSPEGMTMSAPEITGGTVKSLSQERATVIFSGNGDDSCTMEIGYYVLGMRKSVTVTVE